MSENYKYLCNQVEVLMGQQYFENIKKYPLGCFLLGIYNIMSTIKEHNLHIAISTTKIGSDNKNIKILAKVLYNNTWNENVSEKVEEFFSQLFDKNYPEAYYKKYSSVLPIDKLNNELCQYLLEKEWVQVIASLLTFEFIMSKIFIEFNKVIELNKLNKSEFNLLNDNVCHNNSVLLLEMLEGQNTTQIQNGIFDTVNLFISFFNEINNQFYSD